MTRAVDDDVRGEPLTGDGDVVVPSGRRVYQSLVDRIRQEIFRRALRPGDRLPHERALAEQYGIGRSAVREALRVLEIQGLVQVRHGYRGGTFVAEPGALPLLSALDASLRLDRVGVDELYDARRLIEPMLARMATERDAATLANLLSANVDAAEACLAEGRSAIAFNVDFHAILAQSSGNRVVTLIMRAILDLLLEGRERQPPEDSSLTRQAVAGHRQIVDAVAAGDGRLVEALMLAHLMRVHERAGDGMRAKAKDEDEVVSGTE
jgi:GntR family transcriptional regulator, transcriptional repressor for pyruvate dehydrogenase complex